MADTDRKPQDHQAPEPMPFDERTRRVMELRKQIREGTYQPDPHAVAEALMREWGLMDELLEEPDGPADLRAAAARFIVPPGEPEADPGGGEVRTG